MKYKDPLKLILSRTIPHWNREESRPAVTWAYGRTLQCRTAALGGEAYSSENQELIVYHTCKSRACPSCGYRANVQWLRERWAALPDALYNGITFTMPDLLWRFFRDNGALWLSKAPSLPCYVGPILFSTTWRGTAYIARVKKRRKGLSKKKPVRSWVDRRLRRGFRGYPIATVAFYGPNDKLATKVVVSVFLTKSDDPDSLQRWFSDDDLDVRQDLAIGEQILTFLKPYGPRSTVVGDGIIGCPHEEGVDYPVGTSCPQCPYWAGRDRFTLERIQ